MSWSVILPGDKISAKVGTALAEIRTAIVERRSALGLDSSGVATVPASGKRQALTSVINDFRSEITTLTSNQLTLKLDASFNVMQRGGYVKSDRTAFSGIGEARQLAGYSADDWEPLKQANTDVIHEMRAVLELLINYELSLIAPDSTSLVNAWTSEATLGEGLSGQQDAWAGIPKPVSGVGGDFNSTRFFPAWWVSGDFAEITKTVNYSASLAYDHTIGQLDKLKLQYRGERYRGFLVDEADMDLSTNMAVSDDKSNSVTYIHDGDVVQDFDFELTGETDDGTFAIELNVDTQAPEDNPFSDPPGGDSGGSVEVFLNEIIYQRSLRAQDLTYA